MSNTNDYGYLPQEAENNGTGGGGSVDSAKTSPSEPATTSGVPLPKRGRGAQPGNNQALKHGAYTAEKLALKRNIRAFMRRARDVAEEVDVRYGGRPRRRRKAVSA